MPKTPQVSIRGETYAKIKEHCKKTGKSVGKFVDELCQEFLADARKKGSKEPRA